MYFLFKYLKQPYGIRKSWTTSHDVLKYPLTQILLILFVSTTVRDI